ncbi:MAG: carbonic anhydrase [Anaerolineae bacterium]|nr:carbonic anhydrase [Anaerolineae bacterium]
MSHYREHIVHANKQYAEKFDRSRLAMPPDKKLAIVACMDARLTVEEALGLKTGDAHIIRNAGGVVTDDALRSLIISQRLLGTREILVINHTDCGMLTFKDEELRKRLKKETGTDCSHLSFHAFSDPEENVRAQVKKIKDSSLILKDVAVHGLIYHVESGRLQEVV